MFTISQKYKPSDVIEVQSNISGFRRLCILIKFNKSTDRRSSDYWNVYDIEKNEKLDFALLVDTLDDLWRVKQL